MVVLAVAWGTGGARRSDARTAAATATANATWTTAEYGDAMRSVVRAVCFGVFLGVSLALLLSRWLFSAVTPFSFFCSMLWLLIAAAAFVPMVIAFGIDFDFDLTPTRCNALPPERIEYWLCETQSYAYLVLLLAALTVLLLLWVPWVVSSGCAALCNRRTYIRVPAAYVAKADKAGRRTAMAQSRQSGAASAQADFDGDDTIAGCLDEFQRLPLLSLRPRGGAATAVWHGRSAFVTLECTHACAALATDTRRRLKQRVAAMWQPDFRVRSSEPWRPRRRRRRARACAGAGAGA